jgi:hypothetical protein
MIIFLLLPGSIGPSFIIFVGDYGFPVFVLLACIYFLPAAINTLKIFDFIFLLFYLIVGLFYTSSDQREILFLFLCTYFIFRTRKLLMPNYNRILHYAIVLLILGLSSQLILQRLGIYKVDYGELDVSGRFHTSGGDSNLTGFFVALFLFILLTFEYRKIVVVYVIAIIFGFLGVLLTESRGAALLLVPSIFRLFQDGRKFIYISIFLLSIVFISMDDLNNVFSRWKTDNTQSAEDLSSGRISRIMAINSHHFAVFGDEKSSVPHLFDLKPAIYAPHNWYIGIVLNFGYVGLVLIFVFFANVKGVFLYLDLPSKIFILFFIFITLMTESYFLNLHVVYLSILMFKTPNNGKENSSIS